ncbi:class I SAM-dependent methyltransferase [Candidatus Woesearchaeota archaeon]|nr:class I SAM-dependent methyltransferase [Candidatus Woesearchaeota archaeon]MBW3005795.1 class I SAM-dependent methyltransferase [Candidatus Woesearchaeota archaeon]
MDILDIGCGFRPYEGRPGIDNVVTIDQNPRCNPTHTFEVIKGKQFPVKESSFDLIVASHFLEHVDDVPWCMEQIHRAGKPGSEVRITVPHFSAPSSYQDPTHRRHLSSRCMDYFDSKKGLYECGYTTVDFRIQKAQSRFRNNITGFIRSIPSKLFGTRIHEKYISRFVPIAELYFELKVVK